MKLMFDRVSRETGWWMW